MTISKHTEQSFLELFHNSPEFTIRAPGRVNLLGEHTDYNGLPVLPMAIDRTIVVAARPRKVPCVQAVSLQHNREQITFDLCTDISRHPQGHWANYVKAGIQGVISKLDNPDNLLGCDMVIAGDIPAGAGLSSSSALVVASALALLQANQIVFDRITLSEWMAEAEWFVGTRGGGMDQATCLLGQQHHLIKIDFFPLRAEPVPWNPEYAVVICDSGVQAKKSEGALQAYNLRSAECKLGKLLLQQYLNRSGNTIALDRLGGLLNPPHSYSYAELRGLVQRALKDTYSFEEITAQLGNEEAVIEILNDSSIPLDTNQDFHCGKRFRHIVSDGWRVEQSRTYLLQHDMKKFGECMQQGHQSARDDFDISCPELNQLTELAIEHGALGARLTGAGFGGSTVNIVHQNDVDNFITKMQQTYYRNHPNTEITPILVTSPSQGAIYTQT